MGQEISLQYFEQSDFERFYRKLEQETELLAQMLSTRKCSDCAPVAGFEIEAWLIDEAMRPASINAAFLAGLAEPLASAELAKFNIELNCRPVPLTGDVFSNLLAQLQQTWRSTCRHARQSNHHALMIGILPTLRQRDLHLGNMTDMHRYRALNQQILESRGKPIHIDIAGVEHLRIDHHDVMLEAATTSFQTHIQLSPAIAHHFYNAAMIISAPMIAVCANSPFLFGKELWHESRIPLFEQAIATGGYKGAAHGPLKRVGFGSGYAQQSLIECFEENLLHFPVLLPAHQNTAPEAFNHLRLHNGTIWRWNRPLVGFDADGAPHLRVEHRTPAAGPSVIDAIANAAFYYGLSWNMCRDIRANGPPLPFAQAKDNFYQAARYGLDATVTWVDGGRHRLHTLLQEELVPRAEAGLIELGIQADDRRRFLDIVRRRLETRQNGCLWQRRYLARHPRDFASMTRAYLNLQTAGQPVSDWPNP